VLLLCSSLALTGCAIEEGVIEEAPPAIGEQSAEVNQAVKRGRDIWFNNTYGGQKFFDFLSVHPDETRRVTIGFVNVALTPRSVRFQTWGTINDPDCVANPTGGYDICDDPNASGVVGIRKFARPPGTPATVPPQFGVACASCHAGFDPNNPPADPNEPEWDNIHATIGNQYLDSGAIFAVNMAATDPRRFMFAGWAKGTVDTSLLFGDDIMNPGVMTAFWNHKFRPTFDIGGDEEEIRRGQDGLDDKGGDFGARRVYTNIGACFFECSLPAVATNTPINIAACENTCADWPPDQDMSDLGAFLDSHTAPKFPDDSKDDALYDQGKTLFDANCAGCHENSGASSQILSDDEITILATDEVQAPHNCRALLTNGLEGKIWAEFTSPVYKQRRAEGLHGFRTIPLVGVWSTAPFFHNQSIGRVADATDGYAGRRAAYEDSMDELLSATRPPKVNVLPVALGPFPAGTPLELVFSRDAAGTLLCSDYVQNKGHYFGTSLSAAEKDAIKHYVLFQ
jgi:hypothetical protein